MRKYIRLAAVVALAFSGFANAQSINVSEISVSTLKIYKTLRQGEKQIVLPLPKRIQTPQGARLQEQYQVIFSIEVERLSEHDVIQVSADIEATNDCGYDVGFGTWLMIGNDSSRTIPDSAMGEAYLSYPSGYNITNGNYQLPGAGGRSFMHHGLVTRSTIFVVPKGMSGRRYVNLVAYAQTDKLDCKKGGGLSVEKGNGQMNVLHFVSK